MQQKHLEQTRQELKLRNYSFKTIKTYLSCLREYFDLIFNTPAPWGGVSLKGKGVGKPIRFSDLIK